MTWNYNAPIGQILSIYRDILSLDDVLKLPPYQQFDEGLVEAILTEAGKFAADKLLPTNKSGDLNPAKLVDENVITSPGFRDVYKEFIESGWSSVPFDPQYGGQGLPWLVSTTISEMWSSTNMAFALCPLLTQGSIELLSSHGSDEQKSTYLPNLISGKWTGTMCLTEPQAGSDVGALSTKAKKNGDHYLLSGQKIYITYGDHDMAENIIHMVLARTEDAPVGSKGISLFIVPKYLESGDKNDVKALSLEHKMGIHGSPTAVMAFGDGGTGAIGYLVGEENQGLRYMFTMMNNARLAVGIEGVACAEAALQQAKSYADERVQGFDLDDKAPTTIINHPDVSRILAQIEGNSIACRVMCYLDAQGLDLANNHEDEFIRKSQQALVDFLIPVVKAHSTDIGFLMSSEAMQIFGGIGYIEETGIAQYVRDSRIALIYEGTNGIQAMDLVMRKLLINDGTCYESYRSLISDWLTNGGDYQNKIEDIYKNIDEITEVIKNKISSDTKKVASICYDYLKLIAIASSCVIHQKIIAVSAEKICSKSISEEFIIRNLPEVESRIKVIREML